MAFSADGRRVVMAKMSIAGKVFATVWEPATNRSWHFPGHPELEEIGAVALSADGKDGASAAKDGLRVWEVESQKELRHWPKLPVAMLALPPRAGAVLVGNSLGDLVLLDVATGDEAGRFDGHTGAITAAVFSADGGLLLSGSTDGTARLWKVAERKELLKLEHPSGVTCLALSADGRRVLTGGKDGSVRMWELPK